MENNQKVNIQFEEVLIKNVSFERVEKMGMHEYKIDCIDTVTVINCSEEGFRVQYERKTLTKEPFSFTITFDFYCRFYAESKNNFNNDLERIKKFAEDNKLNIVSSLNLPSRASLVIGDISSQLGTPYLSRPYLIK